MYVMTYQKPQNRNLNKKKKVTVFSTITGYGAPVQDIDSSSILTEARRKTPSIAERKTRAAPCIWNDLSIFGNHSRQFKFAEILRKKPSIAELKTFAQPRSRNDPYDLQSLLGNHSSQFAEESSIAELNTFAQPCSRKDPYDLQSILENDSGQLKFAEELRKNPRIAELNTFAKPRSRNAPYDFQSLLENHSSQMKVGIGDDLFQPSSSYIQNSMTQNNRPINYFFSGNKFFNFTYNKVVSKQFCTSVI